ncbi:prepilin peptidase, partial [Microcoleus sp. herbarium7]
MEIIFNSIVYIIVFSFGAAIGSFLNVVVYRLPAGLS